MSPQYLEEVYAYVYLANVLRLARPSFTAAASAKSTESILPAYPCRIAQTSTEISSSLRHNSKAFPTWPLRIGISGRGDERSIERNVHLRKQTVQK